jgi:hypothetical protein
MRNSNSIIMSGANTGNVTGQNVDAGQIVSASFQVVNGDATAVGTVKIQMSNDICTFGNVAASFTPTNWTDIASASVAVASGVAANPIVISQMCFRWIRAVYTRTSGGSTTIAVQINSLGV